MSITPADLRGPYTTVIDVGAFRGDFAMACLREWPEANVLSFEPLEEPLGGALMGSWSKRWQWFAVALGPADGKGQMYRNEFVPSSSMLPMAQLHRDAFPYTERTELVQVGMAMLDEFEHLVFSPALLKIDVQGYELEVLKGAEDVLTYCTGVVLEVSHETLYEGAPTFAEIDGFLGERGLLHFGRVDAMPHPKNPRRVLQSDELWVRS